MPQDPRARTRNRGRAHPPGEAVVARLRAGGAHRAKRERARCARGRYGSRLTWRSSSAGARRR
eukprot:13368333-Alexandrium_andersonii.AAC.1